MQKLYVAMVGLPARGKSTLAKRIRDGLMTEGIAARLFNNGDMRRALIGAESTDPNFYDPNNKLGRIELWRTDKSQAGRRNGASRCLAQNNRRNVVAAVPLDIRDHRSVWNARPLNHGPHLDPPSLPQIGQGLAGNDGSRRAGTD